MIALGVSAENLGDAPFHLGEAGEHFLWGDTNAARCVKGGPGLARPGESQAVSAGGPWPVTCCRLRARPTDFQVGGGSQGPGSQRPLRGSQPVPRGRARPRPRPPARTDPRSRRSRAEAHALTDLVRHPRPLVTGAALEWDLTVAEPGDGAEGGAGRAGRGGGGPRPGSEGPLAPALRAAAVDDPTRKRGPGAARPQL